MRLAYWVVAFLIFIACGQVGYAQKSDTGAAKAHFAAGTSFFKDKRFHDAVDEFLAAYKLSPADELFYNLGLCYDALEDPGRATIYFQRFLAARPEDPKRGDVEQSLYRMSARVGRLVLHVPDGAIVTVDGIAIEIAPPAPLPVTAGTHHIESRVLHHLPVTLDASVGAGLSSELNVPEGDAEVIPTPVVAAPPAPIVDEAAPQRRKFRIAGLSLLAVGVIGLGVGAVGSALASSASSDVTSEAKSHGVFDPSVEARGRRSSIMADVLYPIGGVAVIAGAVLTVLGYRAERPPVVSFSESGVRVAIP